MKDEIINVFKKLDLRVVSITETDGTNVNSIRVFTHLNDLHNCTFSDETIFNFVQAHIPEVIGLFSDDNYFTFILKPINGNAP
jgi:hypothetical protein